MDKTQQTLIDTDLADDTKRYQQWYQSVYAPDSDTDTVAFAPSFSLETLKKRFQHGFEKRREVLQHQICQEWEYPNKKSTVENKQACAQRHVGWVRGRE